jgi:hypothetical protein
MKFFIALITAASLFITADRLLAEQRMGQDVIDKKKEGWYVTGLPLLNYNSDNGLGYGPASTITATVPGTDSILSTSPIPCSYTASFS